jgi:hypothetical protein
VPLIIATDRGANPATATTTSNHAMPAWNSRSDDARDPLTSAGLPAYVFT